MMILQEEFTLELVKATNVLSAAAASLLGGALLRLLGGRHIRCSSISCGCGSFRSAVLCWRRLHHRLSRLNRSDDLRSCSWQVGCWRCSIRHWCGFICHWCCCICHRRSFN